MDDSKNIRNSLLAFYEKIPHDSPPPFEALLLRLKESFFNHFDRSIPKIQCVDYRQMQENNAKGMACQHPSDFMPIDATPDEQYVTYQIFLLRQENIRILGSRFLHPGDQILEIGAGLLDGAGDSNISSTFPKDIAEGFSFCDINPKIVEESLVNHPKAPIKQSDILRLKRDYPQESFDRVVGVNILDTVAMEDLGRCLKELYYVLKPHGTLIHFMNLEPFIYALVHNLANEREILIPILDRPDDRQFLSLGKEEYERTVRSKLIEQGVPPIKIAFLDYVTTLNRVEQERLCNACIFNDMTNEYAALGRMMLPWGRRVTPMAFYEKYMREMLEANGFRIDECHNGVSEKDVRARVGGPCDQQNITYGPMGKESVPDDALEWGHSHFKIFTHGIIATAVP